jgi:hypothetical protein
VKRQLQAKGEKVSHFAAREITVLARQYLAEHRSELMPEAIANARAMILRGDLGKRAQRALLNNSERRQGHCSSNEITVQNSSSE